MQSSSTRVFQEHLLLGLQQRMINISKKEDMKSLLEEMKNLLLSHQLDNDIIDVMSLMVDRIVKLMNFDYIIPTSNTLN